MKILRQHFEKVRLLLELVKKREEAKRDRVKGLREIVDLCVEESNQSRGKKKDKIAETIDRVKVFISFIPTIDVVTSIVFG